MMKSNSNRQNSQGRPLVTSQPTRAPEPGSVKVDGFQQVIDMLVIADPEFRESILKRIAIADPTLAMTLRQDLVNKL
jgi:hypothetical protein